MSDDLLTRLKEKAIKPRFSESLTMKIFLQLDSIEVTLANGYTGKQIAEELGIEQALFYSALHRARKKALKIAAADGQKTKVKPQQVTGAPAQKQNPITSIKTEEKEDTDDDFPKMFASKSSAAFANADLPHINKKKDK